MYLYHDNGCGEKALRCLTFPPMARGMDHKDWRKLDGSNPVWGEEIVCGTCGAPLKMADLVQEHVR